MTKYAVDSVDGASTEFFAADDAKAVAQARRIVEGWNFVGPVNFTVWSVEADIAIGTYRT